MSKDKDIKLPKKGDKIYVGSSYYIDHGEDDFDGGICTIKSVRRDDTGHIFVGVKERPGIETNYEYLMEYQDKWKKEYGDRKGEMNPDFG